MPARIYALAKELKVDSKDLVDLVKKVGITGKGSALASLSDEEAQKVRDHLSGAGKPEPVAAPTATTAPTAVRDVVPTERKHVAIKVGRSSSRTSAPEKPAKPATPAPKSPEPVEPVAEATPAPATPVKKQEVADPGTPAPQPPKPGSPKSGSLGSRIKSRMGVRKSGVGNDPVAPVRRDSTVSGGKMRS
ncbi:MAG: translation initiation factor IF-2, partial [Roseibacillus sp.]|nr:translation initiation factor IF-2 [Roseibacillus sp.]